MRGLPALGTCLPKKDFCEPNWVVLGIDEERMTIRAGSTALGERREFEYLAVHDEE